MSHIFYKSQLQIETRSCITACLVQRARAAGPSTVKIQKETNETKRSRPDQNFGDTEFRCRSAGYVRSLDKINTIRG